MSKHTPGPWRVANGVQIRSLRDQIAKVWMMRNGEGNANARLIAAAPELLAALKQAADAFEIASSGGGVNFYQCARELRAAIAKATGENK